MPVTCQYLLAHRSTQLFSPTFSSPSLYLQAQALQEVGQFYMHKQSCSRLLQTHVKFTVVGHFCAPKHSCSRLLQTHIKFTVLKP